MRQGTLVLFGTAALILHREFGLDMATLVVGVGTIIMLELGTIRRDLKKITVPFSQTPVSLPLRDTAAAQERRERISWWIGRVFFGAIVLFSVALAIWNNMAKG